MRKFLCSLAMVLLFSDSASAQVRTKDKTKNQPATSTTNSNSGKFVFSLAPRAFQKNPLLDMAVITEVTDDGRKILPPTPSRPAYYLLQSAGYHLEGDGAADAPPPPGIDFENLLKKSMAQSSYLVSEAGHDPSLVIIYVWGSHNKVDPNAEDSTYRNLLSRAALVGGTKFAHEMEKALYEDNLMPAGFSGVSRPFYRFRERDDKTRQLVEQIMDDCYYVVASAYDYTSVAEGNKKLLWRTKITVGTQGIGMAEVVPTLIVSGGPFFGQDMTEPSTLNKRFNRDGHVDIGTATVEGYVEPPKPIEESKDKPESKK